MAKKDGEFAAIIALKCETDFVAKTAADVFAFADDQLNELVNAGALQRKSKLPAWRLFLDFYEKSPFAAPGFVL